MSNLDDLPQILPGTPADHDLKCWPSYFDLIINETKTFEVRLADRHFAEGQHLLLLEWDPHIGRYDSMAAYTGRVARATISYVYPNTVLTEPIHLPGTQLAHVIFGLRSVRMVKH